VSVTVVAAITRRGDEILITRRFDNVHLPGLWEFPGGKVESGESMTAALQREIREELGVEIAVGEEFLAVRHEYPGKVVDLHFFDCVLVAGEPQAIEVADLRWVRVSELDGFEFPAADGALLKKLRESSGG
jgi:mutator protein MutT